MDRDRVVALIESEIKRKESQAKAGSIFAADHMEVGEALRIVLDTYLNPPKNVVEVPEPLREKWVKRG